jgi:predicted dehydrogenase
MSQITQKGNGTRMNTDKPLRQPEPQRREAAHAEKTQRRTNLCDVYEPNLELARKDAPQAQGSVDYKDLLARKDIDFVLIASLDHHHCPQLLDSLAAGKDAYLEKPISRSLEESRRMVAAVRQTGRIVQVGMQRRSAPLLHKAKALVDQGVLGKISLIRPMWKWNVANELNNAPLPRKLNWQRFLGLAPKRELRGKSSEWHDCHTDGSGA